MGNFKTAWRAFWQILRNNDKANAWNNLEATPGLKQPTPKPAPEPKPAPTSACGEALHLLTVLQREARFIDYIQEDLGGYDDASVGGVSRKVHDDCAASIRKYFALRHILDDDEQSTVEVPKGFDPGRIRVTGHPVGEPPYQGTLQHRGWIASKASFPQRTGAQDPTIICPAEVEIDKHA